MIAFLRCLITWPHKNKLIYLAEFPCLLLTFDIVACHRPYISKSIKVGFQADLYLCPLPVLPSVWLVAGTPFSNSTIKLFNPRISTWIIWRNWLALDQGPDPPALESSPGRGTLRPQDLSLDYSGLADSKDAKGSQHWGVMPAKNNSIL